MSNNIYADKPYPYLTMACLWEDQYGNINSMPLDATALKAIQAAIELGGEVRIRKRTEKAISGSKNPARAATHILEFTPAALVSERMAKRAAKAAANVGNKDVF